MEQIEIGASGLKTSRIGLGTWAIGGWMWGGSDEKDAIATIRAAVERGITRTVTAPISPAFMAPPAKRPPEAA